MRASHQVVLKPVEPGDAPGASPSSASPASYVTKYRLKHGLEITIRPICPADEPLMIKFHRTLSEQSVYFRYLGQLKLSQRIAHQRLMRVCLDHQESELALVAERKYPHNGESEILGVGRLIKADDAREAEFALVVGDRHQGSGLGTELLRRVIRIARDEGQLMLVGYILPDNRSMLHICEKLGFRRVHPLGDPVVRMEFNLVSVQPTEHPAN